MNRKTCRFACLILLIILTISFSSIIAAIEINVDYLQIGGLENQDPLRITVFANGRLAVEVWQPEFPFSFDYEYTHQYAAANSWGSNLFYTSDLERKRLFTDYYRQTNTPDIAAQLDLGQAVIELNNDSIKATWETAELRLIQQISYIPSSWSMDQTWQITNLTQTAMTDLIFTHGGDTNLGGIDQVCGSWHEDLNLLAIWPQDLSVYGPLFFSGSSSAPATNYFAGLYWQGYEQVTEGLLDNTTSSTYVDSASLLQWQEDELEPGQTWTIASRQQFNPAGIIQIVQPEQVSSEPGTEVELEFPIFYLGAADPELNWEADTENGWAIEIEANDKTALSGETGGFRQDLLLTVQIPPSATAGHVELINLSVMHSDDPWTEYRATDSISVLEADDGSQETTTSEISETETVTTTAYTESETIATTYAEASTTHSEETTPIEENETVKTGSGGSWQPIGLVMVILAVLLGLLEFLTRRKRKDR